TRRALRPRLQGPPQRPRQPDPRRRRGAGARTAGCIGVSSFFTSGGKHIVRQTMEHNPNHKGNIAELAIAAEAAKCGLDVLKPLTEHARYDLVLEIGGTLYR